MNLKEHPKQGTGIQVDASKSTIEDFIKGIKDFQLKFMKLEKRERSGAKQKPKEGEKREYVRRCI